MGAALLAPSGKRNLGRSNCSSTAARMGSLCIPSSSKGLQHLNYILIFKMAATSYAPGLEAGVLRAARHWAVSLMLLHEGNEDLAAQDLRTILGEESLTHPRQFCMKWYKRWCEGDTELRDAYRTGRPKLSYSMSDEAIAQELKVCIYEDGDRRTCWSVAEVRKLHQSINQSHCNVS